MLGSSLSEWRKSSPIFLDTNFFIYHIEGKEPCVQSTTPLFQWIEKGSLEAVTSTLTLLEMSVGPYKQRQLHLALSQIALLNQLPTLHIQELTQDIANAGAKLRAEHALKTPDAIQVATALHTGCKLFVTNDKRLAKIPDIQFCLM